GEKEDLSIVGGAHGSAFEPPPIAAEIRAECRTYPTTVKLADAACSFAHDEDTAHRAASRARAGTPSTVTPAGTSLRTTAPAATTAAAPTVTPGTTTAPVPRNAPAPILTAPDSMTSGDRYA